MHVTLAIPLHYTLQFVILTQVANVIILEFKRNLGCVERIKFLLENGAEIATVNLHDWTPLHTAYSRDGSEEIVETIVSWAKEHAPDFLSTFDRNKPRNFEKKAKRAPHLPLDFETRWRVLDGDVSLKGIAKKIQAGFIFHWLYKLTVQVPLRTLLY